jgi:hypothetical protein
VAATGGFGVANAAIRLSAQSRYRDDLEAPVVGSVFSGETPLVRAST